MAQSTAGWYSQRLEEEQDQLDAVNDALDALDVDKFQSAIRRINNRSVAEVAERIGGQGDVEAALDTLEALAGFLKVRIEYLLPLARDEQRRELAQQHREYAASV